MAANSIDTGSPSDRQTTTEILEALIAWNADKIWASELGLEGLSRRIDFWTLEVATSKGFRTQAYEIKVSRADFLRDSAVKQSAALTWSDRFWYVTPTGLLRKAEIPDWAGLFEWDGKYFRVGKRAPRRTKAEPTWDLVVSILRNSGQVRRDTELLTTRLAWAERRCRQLERGQRAIEQRAFGRTERRWAREQEVRDAAALAMPRDDHPEIRCAPGTATAARSPIPVTTRDKETD